MPDKFNIESMQSEKQNTAVERSTSDKLSLSDADALPTPGANLHRVETPRDLCEYKRTILEMNSSIMDDGGAPPYVIANQRKVEVGDEKKIKKSNLSIKVKKQYAMESYNSDAKKTIHNYTTTNAAMYLPRHLKILSALYKALAVAYKFNKQRNFNLIFECQRASIERMCKHRIEATHIAQLQSLIPEKIHLVPVEFKKNEKNISSFAIEIVSECDIDKALYEYVIVCYKKWLCDRGIVEEVAKFHPEFDFDLVCIEPSTLDIENASNTCYKRTIKNECAERTTYIQKASNIYERIKEKERLRKLEFIKCESKKFDFLKKVEEIFAVTQQKAIKLNDLVYKIGGHRVKEHIVEVCNAKFTIKTIENEEYVVKNNQ